MTTTELFIPLFSTLCQQFKQITYTDYFYYFTLVSNPEVFVVNLLSDTTPTEQSSLLIYNNCKGYNYSELAVFQLRALFKMLFNSRQSTGILKLLLFLLTQLYFSSMCYPLDASGIPLRATSPLVRPSFFLSSKTS